jgi:hypothetical protein
MADEVGKRAKGADAGRKAERKAKRKEGRKAGGGKGGGKGDKEKNPVIEEARARYTAQLQKEGVPQDQLKEKVKAHIKEVVKPAMAEAKTGAKSKNLKGPERKKFVQDSVRSKLGLQA